MKWTLSWPHCAFGVLQHCRSKQLGNAHQTDTIHLHYLVIHLYARDTKDSNYKERFSKHFHIELCSAVSIVVKVKKYSSLNAAGNKTNLKMPGKQT